MANTPEQRRQFFKSFEAQSLKSRSLLTQIADDLTAICGSTKFLIAHIIWFLAWILLNMGYIPQITPFDPFPYGLLTMFVSLEAIFLSIFVLVSQNRSSYISSVREEVHLRVNLIAEEEITKILSILAEMRKEMGIKGKDKELEEMMKRTDASYIERSIMRQMERASKPISTQLKKEFPEMLLYPVKKPIELVKDIATGAESSPTSTKLPIEKLE
ncbi:DUF1003 domain-containing protein [Candidatus Daviesbacteria bacterium]|nr:DUF1003 domain-containing protein [Candidatus Daviesbacteria bacterium]